jgi:hypothetical protein
MLDLDSIRPMKCNRHVVPHRLLNLVDFGRSGGENGGSRDIGGLVVPRWVIIRCCCY